MIRPGDPWGEPAAGPPDATGAGSDHDLAALAAAHRGARLRFEPDECCELARAVGLTPAAPGVTDLPVDALDLDDPALDGLVAIEEPCAGGAAGRAPARVRLTPRGRLLANEVALRLR